MAFSKKFSAEGMKALFSLLALLSTSFFIGAGAAGCFGLGVGAVVGALSFGGFVYGIYREYEDI